MPSTIRGADDFDSLESQGLGDGQTWQDLTASRSAGVTYTNSTGRPIYLSINAGSNGSNFQSVINVDGVILSVLNTDGSTSSRAVTHNAIIPASSTYSIPTNPSSSIDRWWELR